MTERDYRIRLYPLVMEGLRTKRDARKRIHQTSLFPFDALSQAV
jgi:hypothetical protein